MCVWHFSTKSGVTNYLGETRNGNIPPGKAKLCKLLTLERPEKEVLHFTYVTPRRWRKKKQHSIPRSPPSLTHTFLHWCSWNTKQTRGPRVRSFYAFRWIEFLGQSRGPRKQSRLEDVDDWLSKHSLCHPGRQTDSAQAQNRATTPEPTVWLWEYRCVQSGATADRDIFLLWDSHSTHTLVVFVFIISQW